MREFITGNQAVVRGAVRADGYRSAEKPPTPPTSPRAARIHRR